MQRRIPRISPSEGLTSVTEMLPAFTEDHALAIWSRFLAKPMSAAMLLNGQRSSRTPSLSYSLS